MTPLGPWRRPPAHLGTLSSNVDHSGSPPVSPPCAHTPCTAETDSLHLGLPGPWGTAGAAPSVLPGPPARPPHLTPSAGHRVLPTRPSASQATGPLSHPRPELRALSRLPSLARLAGTPLLGAKPRGEDKGAGPPEAGRAREVLSAAAGVARGVATTRPLIRPSVHLSIHSAAAYGTGAPGSLIRLPSSHPDPDPDPERLGDLRLRTPVSSRLTEHSPETISGRQAAAGSRRYCPSYCHPPPTRPAAGCWVQPRPRGVSQGLWPVLPARTEGAHRSVPVPHSALIPDGTLSRPWP